ncbi:MAG: DUF4397 domain-containing protein [Woeseiaceae bacterium]|nr:DUF4397 domain-containing protein [Woeseiaceae bacterium]
MKRIITIASLLFIIGACAEDSSLPNPTGKGTVRGINAVKGSPDISFLIEERLIESLPYKSISGSTRWDDFQYVFNFDTQILGESSLRRIASITQKVDPSRDYTFVASGSLTSPTVSVWETDERTFDDTDTVFEVQLGHAAESLGAVDVYLAADGVVPVVGEERGTLNFGEILDAADFESAEFVLTITAAGDPATVLYQSDSVIYGERGAFIVSLLDGDETDLAPYTVRRFNKNGGGISALPDVRFPPTVRFIQASIDLAPADVYDDEMLTSQILSDHRFGDVSPEIEVAIGTTDLTYTPVGSTGSTLFEGSLPTSAGSKFNFIVLGDDGAQTAASYVPLRRSVSTSARLQFVHAAFNHDLLDLYIVTPGTPIDDDVSPSQNLAFGFRSGTILLDAGTREFYVTTRGEKTIVAGPFELTVALGDVVEAIVLDTVDPATAEIRVIPAP